jgi:hypothetical protein
MMEREGIRCHHFWRITLQVACSRFAEEVVCPCLCLRSCSSSYRLVGRDRAAAKRMRTPLLEVGLQSAQLVVGQHADSPSSLELDEWLFAEVEELVVKLALV